MPRWWRRSTPAEERDTMAEAERSLAEADKQLQLALLKEEEVKEQRSAFARIRGVNHFQEMFREALR